MAAACAVDRGLGDVVDLLRQFNDLRDGAPTLPDKIAELRARLLVPEIPVRPAASGLAARVLPVASPRADVARQLEALLPPRTREELVRGVVPGIRTRRELDAICEALPGELKSLVTVQTCLSQCLPSAPELLRDLDPNNTAVMFDLDRTLFPELPEQPHWLPRATLQTLLDPHSPRLIKAFRERGATVLFVTARESWTEAVTRSQLEALVDDAHRVPIHFDHNKENAVVRADELCPGCQILFFDDQPDNAARVMAGALQRRKRVSLVLVHNL